METTVIKKNVEFVVASSTYKLKKKKSICRNILRFAKPKSLNIQLERLKNHVGSSYVHKNLSSSNF